MRRSRSGLTRTLTSVAVTVYSVALFWILPLVMLKIFSSILLLSLTAEGSKETTCTTRNGKTLQCNFPENINTTRKDYAVYFQSDVGVEEKVVDCAWINEQLHCIRQEGFECNQPVSEKAIIDVPARFVKRDGSFRCNMNGYKPEAISSCRFLEIKGDEPVATCEANINKDQSQVILNCRFPLGVESFIVKKNTTVVASFTKSECQSSSPMCLHQPGDNHDIFSLTLDIEGFPHGEYKCHPEDSPPQLPIKGCSLSREKQTANSDVAVVAVVLPLVCVVVIVSAGAFIFITRRLIIIKKARLRKRQDEENNQVKIALSLSKQ